MQFSEDQEPVITECYILDDTATPNNVLKCAIDLLDEAVVIGLDKTGEIYFASSSVDPRAVKRLLNKAGWILESHLQGE